MDERTRRAFLRAGALGAGTAGLSGIAGCLEALSGTATERTDVETLGVAGSPGGPVPVQPPRTVALLDFFATWCGPCGPQMQHLQAVRDRFGPETLHLLSITAEEDHEAVASFWREYDATWPVALDPDLAVATTYDATRLPTLLLLDADGEEQWRHVGLAAEATITAEIQAVLE